MFGRALGYRPDAPDKRDFDVGRLGLSVSTSPPLSVSLAQDEPPIANQGRASTCVGQTLSAAIEIVERRAHREHPFIVPAPETPSVLFLYFHPRRFLAGGPAIFDSGTFLRVAAKMWNQLGCPDDKYWSYSTNPFRVNRRPSMVASMRAIGRTGGEYYRINETGEDRIRAIKAALIQGYPVCFGTQVTKAFTRNEGRITVGVPGDSEEMAGGHAMVITGFSESADGALFTVRNSWGKGWRFDGRCYFTEDYIRWPGTRDFQIIAGWRDLRGVA